MAGVIHPRARAVIEADAGIIDAYGLDVLRAEDGRCEVSATVPQALVNAAGLAHGSIAFAMMDTACAYAIASTESRGVTTNANISYVKGAQAGMTLTARVEVASKSRRVGTLRGEVHDDGGALIAHGSFVFQLIEVRG